MHSPALLFHIARPDGTVTGPHVIGAIRRELAAGTLNYETPLCMVGTEDWLPLHEWQNEIEPPAPPPVSASVKYAAVLEASRPEKSPVRIMFGILATLSGLSLFPWGVSTVISGKSESFVLGIALAAVGLLSGVSGIGALIRQSRAK